MKTIEQKKAQGTYREDRNPKKPIQTTKILKVPRIPEKYADSSQKKFIKKKWDEICTILINEKRLTDGDLFMIELLCDALLIYKIAFEKVNVLLDTDSLILTQVNKAGQEYESITQWQRLMNTQQLNITKFCAELCITPASRSKVTANLGEKDDNPAETLFNKLLHGRSN